MDNFLFFSALINIQGQNTPLNPFMVFGADYIIYISFILTFFYFLRDKVRGKKIILYLVFSIILCVVIIKLIHLFIYTNRPFVAYQFEPLVFASNDASFPSRHVSLMSAIFFSHLLNKAKWSAAFLVMLFWVGVSRVYTGVHYPIDIIGGLLVGYVSVFLTSKAYSKFSVENLNKVKG